MPAEHATARLEPRLTAFDTSMVVVSLVIGIGIFRTPALVAAATGSAARFLAAWTIGGVVSLVGALLFAEIGSRYPRAGGFYKVVSHCWHPLAAFLLNWAQVLMQGAGAAGVALIGTEYLLRLARPGSVGTRLSLLVAAALVGGLIALNAAGIRSGARVQNVLSLAKIALIAGLAVAGVAVTPGRAEDGGVMAAGGTAPAGMLTALVAVLYAYGGYQNTMNLAGDVLAPRRRLPWGICGGMAIVAALYLAVNAAYIKILGPAGVASSPLVAADLARQVFGGAGEAFVSLAIFLSAAGFVNATVLHVPRSYLAMADDGLLPSALGRLNSATQAQGAGLVFFAATALVPLLFLGSFEKLVGYVMFTDELSLAVVASCLFVLRRRGEGDGLDGVWRMPGYPWLPALFVLIVLGVAVDIVVHQTRLAIAGTAVVVAGLPLYFVMRRSWKKTRPADRDASVSD